MVDFKKLMEDRKNGVRKSLTQQEIDLDHTPLTFGKHKGLTPDQVSEDDPGWLVWAYENVKNRDVCSKTLYDTCRREAYQYKKDKSESRVKELNPEDDLHL